jgi:hypothetical protein
MLLGHGHTAGVWTLSIDMKNCPSLRSGQFRGQKGLCTIKKSVKMPYYMFCPRKKIISWTFKTSGTLLVNLLCTHSNSPTAVLGSHISLRAPRHGGDPSVYWQAGGGDLHI